MTAKSANVLESFASLVQFYPKLGASIALGVMSVAVDSMKALGSVGDKSAQPIEAPPLPSLPIPGRVRSPRQPKEKRPAARKSTKRRSTRRRKAA
jgi:hypothetical protein